MTSVEAAPLATFGLASQLRTPPSPSDHSLAATGQFPTPQIISAAKKVTPAMRAEQRQSSKVTSQPAWISRTDSASSIKKHRQAARDSLTRSTKSEPEGEIVLDASGNDQAGRSSKMNPAAEDNSTISQGPPSPETIHITKAKSMLNQQRSAAPMSDSIPPPRPSRPRSPNFLASALETPISTSPTAQARNPGEVEFAFAPLGSLDLGVQFDGATGTVYSTYSPASASGSASAPSPREGSESATTMRQDVFALAPPRPTARQESPSKPIGLGLRQNVPFGAPSHGASLQMAMPFPSATTAPAATSTTNAPAGFVVPNNSGRLPGNLLSLARRTAHISDTPGYGWRLNLLEKLEVIMGSFLTIQDAESILSIGASPSKKSNRTNERKSLIGMPPALTPKVHRKLTKNSDPGTKNTFFFKMKRALGNPAGDADRSAASRAQVSKGIFGVPLTIAAEYGFVTSMIAGQRHELPGVCFSSVEEIYRRGQGMNVPGLLVNAGEASRIAKLVAIFDSPPDYGEHHDLSIESIHNVTSLLKKYLRDLPEPILDQRLWKVFLSACVFSTNPIENRVTSAQVILRLLPTPNFSLLVYLVAFLSQIPLFPENRVVLETVATIFGTSIMSPRGSSSSNVVTKGGKMLAHITGPTDIIDADGANAKKAQDALLWLLKHWSLVADGLLEPDFDVDVDAVLDRDPATMALISASGSQTGDFAGELDGAADPLRFLPYEKTVETQSEANASRQTLIIGPSGKPEVEETPTSPTSPAMQDIQPSSHSASIRASSPVAASFPRMPSSPVMNTSNALQQESPALLAARSHETMPDLQRNTATAFAPIIAEPEPEEDEEDAAAAAHRMSAIDEDEEVPPPTPSKEGMFDLRNAEDSARAQDLPTTPIDDSDSIATESGLGIHQVASRELEEDFVVPDVAAAGSAMPALDTEGPNSSRSSSDASAQSGTLTPSSMTKHESVLASFFSDRSERNSKASRRSIGSGTGFPRSQPEDEYGPIAPMGTSSVLDDLMDFDDDPTSYKFPSPPGSTKGRTADLSPTVLASLAKMQATRRASRASISSDAGSTKSSPRSFPRLIDAEVHEEAKRTIDVQRVEITDLWKQLTDLEGERETERRRLSHLHGEMLELRSAADAKPQVNEAQIRSEWEAKLAESHEEVQSARKELEEVKKEMRAKDDEAKKQIASLSSQLDAIRSLLMSGMGAGASA